MTSEEYYALNQANAKRFPTMQPQRQTMGDFMANNRRTYGYNGTYADGQRYAAQQNKKDIFYKAVLPTIGFAAGGAALGALGSGAGAAGGSAAAGSTALPSASSGIGTTAGYGSLFGGGGASAAGGSAVSGGAVSGGGAAAGAGSKFSLGTLLKFGVPLVTNYLGQRSENKALDKKSQMEQATLAEQIAFAREQEAFRRAEAERVAVEDRRRWEAEQVNLAKQLAAQEEERAYLRAQADYDRRLREEREGRRSQARMRLDDFLRRGR